MLQPLSGLSTVGEVSCRKFSQTASDETRQQSVTAVKLAANRQMGNETRRLLTYVLDGYPHGVVLSNNLMPTLQIIAVRKGELCGNKPQETGMENQVK